MAYLSHSPLIVAQGGTGLTTITAHTLIVGNGTGTPALLAPSATAGIPVVSAGAAADPIYGTVVVPGGGTGVTTFTAYAPIMAGTTATGSLQQATTGFSTAGYVLTSNGAAALPSFQSAAASITPITDVVFGQSPYTVLSTDEYIAVNVTGGAISILLPNAPTTGRNVTIKDKVGLSATSNITVTTVGGAVNIDGATTYVINSAYASIDVIFDGSTYQIY